MSQVQFIQVEQDRTGQRIDNFIIGQLSKLPKTLIYRWIRKGELRVNKKRIKQTYRVQAGDLIRIPPFMLKQDQQTIKVSTEHLAFLESLILFENEDYLIINKPSGIAVHGGSGINSGLIERLQHLRPNCKKLELAHRLDKETSGCLTIAKKYSILTYFHQILKAREVQKTYHALTHNQWPKHIKQIELPLKRTLLSHGERIVKVDRQAGKEALTHTRVLARFKKHTLVEAKPHTGRTHQIRVHLAAQNCPIVCDKKYGLEQPDQSIKHKCFDRLFLHAYTLEFKDPKTNEKVCFKAPYDQPCQSLIDQLTKEI